MPDDDRWRLRLAALSVASILAGLVILVRSQLPAPASDPALSHDHLLPPPAVSSSTSTLGFFGENSARAISTPRSLAMPPVAPPAPTSTRTGGQATAAATPDITVSVFAPARFSSTPERDTSGRAD